MKMFLRKRCSCLVQMLMAFMLIAIMAMPALAVGPNSTVFEINKGQTQTLFSGAITASVTAGNATEIAIKGYRGGLLQVQTVSGSGIGANYLKLVPTLTGSGTSTTFTFTPFK